MTKPTRRSGWARPEVDRLVSSGAALRGLKVPDAETLTTGSHVAAAVYEVGQAIYGANSVNPKGVRDHIAGAIREVQAAFRSSSDGPARQVLARVSMNLKLAQKEAKRR